MILQTTKKEAAALFTHLTMMRPNFRNLLKKSFKDKKDEYLKAYDYVKQQSQDQLEEDIELHTMHLNIVDVTVLEDFLKSYLAKAVPVWREAKLPDYEEHAEILEDVQSRCRELLADVS